MEGLSTLFTSLYGVKLEHQRARTGELWNSDIQKLVKYLEIHSFLL